jgi:AcrR family transcriptional regulator
MQDKGRMIRAVNEETGRVNQKLRTRMAIVEACREVIRSGGQVTMPAVASAALVSEPTAYRYFADLTSLLNAALVGMWPSPAEALEPIAASADPVERVAFASEFFLRRVLSYQGAVRAMISATITRPELAAHRPGIRFGLINQALDPIADTLPLPPERLAQLKHDLAAIISAEALFSLTDMCRLTSDDAVGSLVRTATTITANATHDDGTSQSQPGKRRSPRL